MSYLPQLNSINKSQSVQQEFRGLNHNNFLDETELYDMKNMCVDNYPYASPRKKRGTFKDENGDTFGTYTYENGKAVMCNGIATKQGFCFVEGTGFFYKSNTDNVYRYVGEVEDGEKQFVSLSSYILIFPDKKYFNSFQYINQDKPNEWFEERGLEKTDFFGSLEAEFTGSTPITLNMCNVYGEDYEFKFVSKNEPEEDVDNGDMWLDISSSPAKMMQYSEAYSGWLEITSNYIKITFSADITKYFNGYDGVTISGFPKALDDFNSATVIYQTEKNENGTSYIVLPGIISPQSDIESHIIFNATETNINNSIEYYPTLYKETITELQESGKKKITINYYANSDYSSKVYSTERTEDSDESDSSNTERETESLTNISVKRSVPDMDFVCELDNRLWGCSNENHEIYSSKLGDPFNFNFFLGLSTDSGVITIGSDGDFTGCIAHLGYVLFFKENCVHKIYGTKPTNYQVTNVTLRGVQQGCEKSMCIVNETLFYKAKTGVMMFQGSLPECISDELGTDSYSDAVAGYCGNKYYISMKNSSGIWDLYVYDTVTGFWHKEDNTRFKYTLSTQTELYYIDGNDSLMTVGGTGDAFSVERLLPTSLDGKPSEYDTKTYSIEKESEFEWSIESGDLYSSSIDNKYISRLRILMELRRDTKINVYLKYDNDKKWECVCTKRFKYLGSTKNTYNIPVIPRRSRRMKIKISGTGECLIQAIAKSVEQGSEL